MIDSTKEKAEVLKTMILKWFGTKDDLDFDPVAEGYWNGPKILP